MHPLNHQLSWIFGPRRRDKIPVASRDLRRLLLCIAISSAIMVGLVYWVMHLIAS